jgi:hypothetical protein
MHSAQAVEAVAAGLVSRTSRTTLFYSSSLNGVTVPDTIISVAPGAFGQCAGLGTMSLDFSKIFARMVRTNITLLRTTVVWNCRKLKSMALLFQSICSTAGGSGPGWRQMNDHQARP